MGNTQTLKISTWFRCGLVAMLLKIGNCWSASSWKCVSVGGFAFGTGKNFIKIQHGHFLLLTSISFIC